MSASVNVADRDGRHQVRWREAGGRRRARTFSRERDATSFAARVRRQLELGGLVVLDEEVPTLAEFVEDYWRMHAIPNLSANTRKTYMAVWGRHVLPRLGDLSIRALTPGVVDRQLVDPMRRAGAGDQVIRKTLTMLQSVMSLAVLHHHEAVPTNPVAAVRKPAQRRREATPIWPSTVELIRARMKPRDATLVSVLAYAGLRPEEALALRWADVRPDAIVVERAVALGELREDDTHKRHNRVVSLLAPLAKDLAEWRLASARPLGKALLFARGDGSLWRDHDWRNWRTRVWQPALDAAGVGEIHTDGGRRRYVGPGPYQLRGSFVSLLIQEGRTVVEVAEQAGHTPETCLRHYARLFRDAPARRVPAERAIKDAREALRCTLGRGADAPAGSGGGGA